MLRGVDLIDKDRQGEGTAQDDLEKIPQWFHAGQQKKTVLDRPLPNSR